MPILHLSQLIGVAAGLEESELKFKRHVVSVAPVVEKLERLTAGDALASRTGRVAPRRPPPRPRGLAWGLFEAGWVRLRVLEVPLDGLPPELDGLRIAHLSDFHLGVPSRGAGAVERAVAWTARARPDLSCLRRPVSRAAGEGRLARARRSGCRAVYAPAREPRRRRGPRPVLARRRAELDALPGATLLRDESAALELRRLACPAGRRRSGHIPARAVASAAADRPRRRSAHPRLALPRGDPPARARLVPPRPLGTPTPAGRSACPWPGGKLRLAHLRARHPEGLYPGPPALHVSAGLGTTLVPVPLLRAARGDGSSCSGRGKNRPVRVSAKIDYALRACAELAAAAGEGPIKGERLAAAQDVPVRFLENILLDLRHAGIVSSQRGSVGGYWLARPPRRSRSPTSSARSRADRGRPRRPAGGRLVRGRRGAPADRLDRRAGVAAVGARDDDARRPRLREPPRGGEAARRRAPCLGVEMGALRLNSAWHQSLPCLALLSAEDPLARRPDVDDLAALAARAVRLVAGQLRRERARRRGGRARRRTSKPSRTTRSTIASSAPRPGRARARRRAGARARRRAG